MNNASAHSLRRARRYRADRLGEIESALFGQTEIPGERIWSRGFKRETRRDDDDDLRSAWLLIVRRARCPPLIAG